MPGIIQPAFYEAAKHIGKLCLRPDYRRLNWLYTRYGSVPRQTRRQIKVRGWQLEVPDVPTFLTSYQGIFVDESYAFLSDTPQPVILDCGANIGLSVLYFKSLYPQARILAFEADPQVFRVLQENVHGNGYPDVELINKAVWTNDTTVSFSTRGGDAGRIDVGGDDRLVSVPAVRLAKYLETMTIDFLKIDIEGAETEVLRDCAPLLGRLKNVYVEFHSFTRRRQELGSLLEAFQANGFRVHVHSHMTSKRPFMQVREQGGMDLQLNLFFRKDQSPTGQNAPLT